MLTRDQLLDKIHGAWLGKAIGGTLGAPYECHKEPLEFTFFFTRYNGAADDETGQTRWPPLG